MTANIFISFASQDRKIATVLCNALEARGFACWISARDILPGENFQVAIVQAIRASKIMLLVFTENSNRSEEMTKELALASQQKLIVIPLRVEDVTPNEAFSYEFATRQWIDCFADWEFAMDQLSQRISNALGAPAARVPPLPPVPDPVAAPLPAAPPAHANDQEAPGVPRRRPLRRMAIAAALIVAAIGLGLSLGLPNLKRPAGGSKAVLAVATLRPAAETPEPAVQPEAPVAEPIVADDAKAAPKAALKRKPKAARPAAEEIPY